MSLKRLKTLIDLLRPIGDCLEIGTGAATPYFQTFTIKSLTTIDFLAKPSGMFDTILIDNSDLPCRGKAKPVLEKTKEIFTLIHETFPDLHKIHYTDQEIKDCWKIAGSKDPTAFSSFLLDLKNAGQISQLQYETTVEKYSLQSSPGSPSSEPDILFPLVVQCVHHHLRKGGRLACFFHGSSYDDPRWFDQIITHSSLEVLEKEFSDYSVVIIEKM